MSKLISNDKSIMMLMQKLILKWMLMLTVIKKKKNQPQRDGAEKVAAVCSRPAVCLHYLFSF
jgi:hypothetical protein